MRQINRRSFIKFAGARPVWGGLSALASTGSTGTGAAISTTTVMETVDTSPSGRCPLPIPELVRDTIFDMEANPHLRP